MRTSTLSSSPHQRLAGQEGAAAVEFAIISVLVFALVFGMFSGALAWHVKQSMNHAVREGLRYGATLPEPDGDSTNANPIDDWLDWQTAVGERAIAAAFGELNNPPHAAYVCIGYVTNTSGSGDPPRYEPYGSPETTGVAIDLTGLPDSHCISETDPPPDGEARIHVYAARSHYFHAIVMSWHLVLQAPAIGVHEAGL